MVIAHRLGCQFFRGGGSLLRMDELFRVKEWTAQRRVVAGPGTVKARFPLEVSAHGFHLGVEIVHVMEYQRLRKHGELGRSELIFAVVTDDEVLDKYLQFSREVGLMCELGLQHLEFDNHVAEKLALGTVGKRPVVRE